jgi:hypothetical protein
LVVGRWRSLRAQRSVGARVSPRGGTRQVEWVPKIALPPDPLLGLLRVQARRIVQLYNLFLFLWHAAWCNTIGSLLGCACSASRSRASPTSTPSARTTSTCSRGQQVGSAFLTRVGDHLALGSRLANA